jgi:uncharacterized protein YndB with AHSA1/START domain
MAINVAVKPSLTIKRHIKAPPAKVFKAWTDPEKIALWFGPPGSKVVESKFETRVGGAFMVFCVGATGDEFYVSGTVKEAVADRRLVYTWAWRGTPDRVSLVTTEFKPDGDGTLMTLTHEQFFDEAARDRHKQGWEFALDNLAKVLA